VILFNYGAENANAPITSTCSFLRRTNLRLVSSFGFQVSSKSFEADPFDRLTLNRCGWIVSQPGIFKKKSRLGAALLGKPLWGLMVSMSYLFGWGVKRK
jgi:hypothetical protein